MGSGGDGGGGGGGGDATTARGRKGGDDGKRQKIGWASASDGTGDRRHVGSQRASYASPQINEAAAPSSWPACDCPPAVPPEHCLPYELTARVAVGCAWQRQRRLLEGSSIHCARHLQLHRADAWQTMDTGGAQGRQGIKAAGLKCCRVFGATAARKGVHTPRLTSGKRAGQLPCKLGGARRIKGVDAVEAAHVKRKPRSRVAGEAVEVMASRGGWGQRADVRRRLRHVHRAIQQGQEGAGALTVITR